MNDSILLTIRKLIGPGGDHEFFDADYILHINAALMILRQLGVGPKLGYSISGVADTWADFLGEQRSLLESVQTYVYLKVKKIFDPPASGTMAEAMNSMINELEWRINVAVDPGEDKL